MLKLKWWEIGGILTDGNRLVTVKAGKNKEKGKQQRWRHSHVRIVLGGFGVEFGLRTPFNYENATASGANYIFIYITGRAFNKLKD